MLTVSVAGADLFGEDGQSRAEDLDVTRAGVDLQQEQRMALRAALESGGADSQPEPAGLYPLKGEDMILHSKELGRLEVDDGSVLYCNNGLVGFEEHKRFYLAEVPEYDPFLWMMSVAEPEVGFAVADPRLFFPGHYEVNLGECDRDALDLQPGDTISVFLIVSITDGGRQITANLKGPVVLNTRNRICRQVVIYNPAYSMRQPLLGPSVERIPLAEIACERVAARG